MFQVISRKDARARGLRRYFTGKPCKQGHLCERFVLNGDCTDCNKQKQVRQRQRNVERYRKEALDRYYADRDNKLATRAKQQKRAFAALRMLLEMGVPMETIDEYAGIRD